MIREILLPDGQENQKMRSNQMARASRPRRCTPAQPETFYSASHTTETG
jgi:hypothetical protein